MLPVMFALLVAWPAMMLVAAGVTSQLWAWFLVPMGAPAVGVAHALGICLIVGSLTYQSDVAKRKSGDDPWGELLGVALGFLLRWLLVLGVAAAAHASM